MARLEYEQLRFQQRENTLRIIVMKHFYFDIPKEEAQSCGLTKVDGNSIEFEKISERKARQQVLIWLERHQQQLTNSLNGKQTAYIHQYSGLPLIGNTAFGIVDRGTNIIEVKPVTACNIKCVFCSVDEDQRPVDFVIERAYLVDELRKLIEYKADKDIEMLLGVQGEVFFYPELIELIEDIRLLDVARISLITNGSFFTKSLIHQLEIAGLTRVQVSINAIDPALARKIADAPYDVTKVLQHITYICKATAMDVMVVPVYVAGLNDEEIPKIIAFAKEVGAGKTGPAVGLQNYLPYKHGKDPKYPPVSMEVFEDRLKAWESMGGIKLHLTETDLRIHPCKVYLKPMRKGEKVAAVLWGKGRLNGEWLAVAKDRTISFFSNKMWQKGKTIQLEIVRTKHNIFIGNVM